jgi:thiol-disulfide isomerase/thioredoxin
MKKLLILFPALFCCFLFSCKQASPPSMKQGWWRATLQREDGNTIDFNVEVTNTNGKLSWSIRNAGELLQVTAIEQKGDSLVVQMPLFESAFYLQWKDSTTLQGKWIKGTSTAEQVMPVTFIHNQPNRYPLSGKNPVHVIGGRWTVKFEKDDAAVAEFIQSGEVVTGTFLTPTGDYRYLEGTVAGDSLLRLSTFDGGHAYFFRASIQNDSVLTDGIYCSGAKNIDHWTAVKNPNATIQDSIAAVYLKPGQERLSFQFPDLDSNMVSINDPRFQNKAVIVQIMGSWCPNCMDETAFLSDYYEKNKHLGVEVVALAYEYSTDFSRSQKGLRKFQKRFNIQYPMLITGVRTLDTLRTEKTLPQITPIRMFPTTLFIGRDGKVKKIDTGFNGPGTGEHYEAFKKEFYSTMKELIEGGTD